MKTKHFLSALLFTFSFNLSPCTAQIPQGFNYQAVARNASGLPIINQSLPVRMTIQSDSLGGTIFWQELHTSVFTNSQGVINLVLGKGMRQAASTAASFTGIDWSITPKFLKIEIDYSGWKTMGVSRLWSVPYSMLAGDLAGSVKKLAVEGETSGLEEALFEVKNKDGQTVFAVYNEGVRIYVDDGAKGKKGGFAVGGFDMTKETKREYLVVSDDSIRMYLDSNIETKGKKGGFAVGGFDMTKGAVPFMSLTPENYFIGHEAGLSNTTGLHNSFLGYNAGRSNTIGNKNIFIGYEAGFNTVGWEEGVTGGSEGSWNCFIGYQAGYSNTHGANNTFIGSASGKSTDSDHNTCLGSNSGTNNTGGGNTFIGSWAGMKNTTGSNNVFLGRSAGWNINEGNGNTFIGLGAGSNIKSGNDNIVIGSGAAGENYWAGSGTGSSNIIIGNRAGYTLSNTSSNIFIGNEAGYNETGSNLLVIENSSSATPLVYGNFESNKVNINGDLSALTVNTLSDIALKKNIIQLTDVIEKLNSVRGVYFNWNLSETTCLLLKEGRQIGFIAQEIEKVYPELVITNEQGYKMVDYSRLTPVLLEAVKEQQQQIESFKFELQTIKEEVEQIKAMLAKRGE